jgi:hypothetical protein
VGPALVPPRTDTLSSELPAAPPALSQPRTTPEHPLAGQLRHARPGEVIRIPAGTYHLGQGIVFEHPVTLLGGGRRGDASGGGRGRLRAALRGRGAADVARPGVSLGGCGTGTRSRGDARRGGDRALRVQRRQRRRAAPGGRPCPPGRQPRAGVRLRGAGEPLRDPDRQPGSGDRGGDALRAEQPGRDRLPRERQRRRPAEPLCQQSAVRHHRHGPGSSDAEENICRGNQRSGIAYFGEAGGEAASNTCQENERYGISLSEPASPVLGGNDCRANALSGSAYFGSSAGSARQNLCTLNQGFGIFVGERAGPTLDENACRENAQDSLRFDDEASGSARHNDCAGNQHYGIYVGVLASPQLDQTAASAIACAT